ncbi:proton-conducting transporter membrane subunit [Pistricoccus aurantiacus]|uniref:proton-conducting transporter transmembrane domain-containing protein n=1 Tax=Pistricoccus aurantiacus TaxID=1883414 RepID=UPI00363B78F4
MPTLSLLVLILLSSLIPAIANFFIPESRAGWRNSLNLVAALVKSSLVIILLVAVLRGELFEVRLALLPGIDFVLHADAWSLMFISLSSLLWLLTTLYAIGYLAHSHQRSRFFGFFSLCVFATSGIALSGNLITFLIFYELLTLATYPLVVHKGDPESIRAGRKYLAYTLFGGTLFLAGVVWLTAIAGPIEFSATGVLSGRTDLAPGVLQGIFLLLIAGLGVKAALVPLHSWLPVSMVAPAPVSALLHAVAVVKAGAFGISRIVYDVYGVEFAAVLGVTTPLAIMAATTIIYGSTVALFQDGLKRRLAFSTISQVSYIALGTAIAGPIATVGGIIHLVHQGLMKITLFFCAGNLDETLGITKVSQMNGVGRRMPWTMTAFSVAALGMIGVPPLAGFVSKWYIGFGAVESGAYWVIPVLVGSSLLNAAYFLPILYAAWFKAPDSDQIFAPRAGRLETHWMLLLPPLLTAGLSLAAGIFAKSSFSPLEWGKLIAAREYDLVPIAELSFTRFQWWIVASLLLPLALALTALIKRLNTGTLRLLPWATLPALGLALLPADTANIVSWLFLGSVLQVDELARPFLLFTALLWLTCGIYARGYLREDPDRGRFAGFFLLAMTGNFGLILAADLSSFIVFFTLMSLASYGLVVHRGDARSRLAGRVYIRLVIVGEMCLYAALVVVATESVSLSITTMAASLDNPWSMTLLMIGFGIKAGLLPLHVWLPLAHPVAPAPASAVLSGAMVAAGLLGWLRFLPLGLPGWEAWGILLTFAGLLAVFYGALIGVLQREAKIVLAYSTISQMGLMTSGVGMMLWRPELAPLLIPALALYALHHGLAKGALFLATAVTPAVANTGPVKWIALTGLLIPALAIVGAPLTSGALAKVALKTPVVGSEIAYLLPLLTLGAIASTLLMVRLIVLLWPSTTTPHDANIPMWLGWSLSVVLVLIVPWWLPGFDAATEKALAWGNVWSQSWPIVLGIVLMLAAYRMRNRFERWSIPSGDILIPLARLTSRATQGVGAWKAAHDSPIERLVSLPRQTRLALARLGRNGFTIVERSGQQLAGLGFGAVLLGLLLTMFR